MAGQGKKTFSDGEVLSAADVNGYLMDQSVMRFADSSARTAAIGTPTEGMVTYLDDVNQIEIYDGTAWVDQQAPILSEGTAGQYLQSNGTAGSQWVTLEIADNIITTEGDLIVGGSDNTPERLPIGAEDTVLTSDGTAISWATAGGGGGFTTLLNMPPEVFSRFTFPIQSNSITKFSLITTTSLSVEIKAFDTNGDLVTTFNVARNSPFTFIKESTSIAYLEFYNDTISVETPILVITDTQEAETPEAVNVFEITETQSVTLDSTYNALLIGGGGGGGGGNNRITSTGGGGGSGYLTVGTVSAGTYTATIGAGGTCPSITSDGTSGGTTSIDVLTALGGNGGSKADTDTVGGAGGNGGSGGGGGAAAVSLNDDNFGGAGGIDGDSGLTGGSNFGADGGAGGTGSEVQISAAPYPRPFFINENDSYIGGDGGDITTGGLSNGASPTTFGSGGGGANAERDDNVTNTAVGGTGKSGFILLVKA